MTNNGVQVSLTQQVSPFIHIPDDVGARGGQLLEQGVRVAVEGDVLNAFGRGAAEGKDRGQTRYECQVQADPPAGSGGSTRVYSIVESY